MIDTKILDDLAKQFRDAIPPGVSQFGDELEQNFRSIIQAAFAKLDLVTREEFDAQVRVLERSRKKLDQLEKKVKKLETKKP